MCDTTILLQSITFAADKHRNQRRKNEEKTPYINHPISVARIISEIGGVNETVPLVGAILHDTIEDTGTTYKEIELLFGEEVAKVVMEVTDDRSLTKIERKKSQIERAPHKSYFAKLIKLADKLDNLSDLLKETPKGWNEEIVHGYFVWSYKVVEGLRGTNQHLEAVLDKIFKQVIDPNEDLDIAVEKYYRLL